MTKLILSLPGNETLTENLVKLTSMAKGELLVRNFPDGESLIQIKSEVSGKEVVLVCSLHQPDEKLLPLYFLAKELRHLQVARITLVAPYLAYMRQDQAFHAGEVVTSKYFAQLLSSLVDELITIDPHLHRWKTMSDIYTIPSQVLHASETISAYIKSHIPNPVLIGPDSESEQWVAEVAKQAGVPFLVLQKVRRGDEDVQVSVPQVEQFKDHTPVLVDDIISTARTMIETVNHLKAAGMKAATCIGVHAVFAGKAYDALKATGAEIITCNTIPHHSNKIDLSNLIAGSLI
ncbi:ribose-phosphate pyrophosphokinase [Adhaeribacter soli]|uniref:ribose-phosphate diphosphokinase n=1 Tax=Adhaeribacter soli TaxID=2607655 RepID=A0A5N1IJV0_9BACT|nr:ribose-phosphate pyrophosphokinase [Adhaeribacter soli]KAA9324934.1 ribose-phosphate pyrophosphokinase [Adhaeribacter soli]